jgi:[ribosomal protein S5]-alanine N-acetyltransferase
MSALLQVTLATPRLRLRWITPDDDDALFAIFSDPVAMRYWSTAPWRDMTQAEASIRQALSGYQSGDSIRFGITLAGAGELVGTCTLFDFDRGSRRAQIGYALARAYWGRGLMHEALTATISYAFDDLQLRRLEADIDPRNIASAKALERLGFLKEGYLRERWMVDGEVSDSALYGLLAGEWRRRRQP